MKVTVELKDYNELKGLEYSWEGNFSIETQINNNGIVIKANKEGLFSLANQLLTLAQDEVPSGSHFHYDEYNSLESGSCDLVISKIG